MIRITFACLLLVIGGAAHAFDKQPRGDGTFDVGVKAGPSDPTRMDTISVGLLNDTTGGQLVACVALAPGVETRLAFNSPAGLVRAVGYSGPNCTGTLSDRSDDFAMLTTGGEGSLNKPNRPELVP